MRAGVGVNVGRGVTTFPIDEHERFVGTQSAQAERIRQRAGVETSSRHCQRRQKLGEGISQVRHAGLGKLSGSDNIDG